MSGVVIRCPQCGTTQAALGECEACHEGDARWYCPNHAPGRWLDTPACSCGARPGVSPPSAPVPPPTAPRAGRPTRRTDALPRYDTTPPRRRPVGGDTPVTGEVRDGSPGATARPGGELLDMLLRAASAAAASRGAARAAGRPAAPARARGGPSLFGCLRRLVLLGVLLFILAMIAFFFLFGQGGMLYRATMSGQAAVPAQAQLATLKGPAPRGSRPF